MTLDEVVAALSRAGFCGIEVEEGRVFARIAAQSPEFRAERTEGQWQLILPWNVRPPEEAIAQWNSRMGLARMQVLQGEASLMMPFPDDGVLFLWAALAAEAETHFIRWRRSRRAVEGM